MPYDQTGTEHGRGRAVTDPAALTSPATFAATYTAAELNALRADVVAIRTSLTALLDALRDANIVD